MNVHETPLMATVIEIARQAGQAVMTVYRADDFEVMLKSDQSPLTQADLAAHHCIVEGLRRLPQSYPVVSEEDAASHIGSHGDRYWLIDPLDGTREFVARSDEFTVNIALIDHGQPVLGVVFAPALDLLYCGAVGEVLAGEGAVRIQDGQVTHLQLQAPAVRPSPCRVVASKNHLNQATRAFIEQLGDTVLVQAGSSLKICRVAEGEADIYPRLGPTSEWDTAAAHAVLKAAGGVLVDTQLQPLRYGKTDSAGQAEILNPSFIAAGALGWVPAAVSL